MSIILDIQNVTHGFGDQIALDDISFSVKKGEVVGLIGRSGAGKSTLLRCLCALERPQKGSIILNGTDLTKENETSLTKIRREIGLVFQHFNLLTSRSVAGNIALPLQIAGWSKDRQKARVKELLQLVGLEKFEKKYPSQLSGGQKQRVGIARALAASPSLLLCDEATSALDPEATTSIFNLLNDINQKLGLTIILITHEMDVVRRFAQHILVLDHGKLVENGTFFDLLCKSSDQGPLQALLADSCPQLPSELRNQLQHQPSPGLMPVLRLIMNENTALKPLFSLMAERFHVETILLQGGVTSIEEKLTGDMIIGLKGEKVFEAQAFLATNVQHMEAIGYVPVDR
ncbi:ATP-binding cassette domain-containing protein [Aristophania vespae]|uniref:Cell division ATP-binding protein FtsE n=1 Tax=Aristophania vespae TaxID=2697033 RepID=A0A6P1NMM2_9PROT|nr:ATP-binding cassette domain-containing protein [Aristophania vespae]QHI96091.1 ATP-binding cassette domain-containing protein [Aristophania vespae]UMM63858.1 Methionine import ATP-binding protein MetN [Aristophania vespae]